jgi:type I restriction enzyme R subunit
MTGKCRELSCSTLFFIEADRSLFSTSRPDPATPALIAKVREVASKLAELERIPAVKKEIVLIQEIQGTEYWKDITLPMLEQIRRRLRDLVKFIPKSSRKIVVTDFEDELGASVEVEMPNLSAAIDRSQYKKKFLEFLKAHEDHLALKKVKYNEPLTSMDLAELDCLLFESGEIGSREDFENCYRKQEHLSRFIWQLVGLDREAAKRAFDSYLQTTSFNRQQIEFINQIIDYLTQNGVMDPKMLFEHPFTNLSPSGPTGLFQEEDAAKIVRVIRTINTNAEAVSA